MPDSGAKRVSQEEGEAMRITGFFCMWGLIVLCFQFVGFCSYMAFGASSGFGMTESVRSSFWVSQPFAVPLGILFAVTMEKP